MSGEGVSLVLEGISVVKDTVSKSAGGISYRSDQITYPADLDRVPDDAYPKGSNVLSIAKAGYLFHSDSIWFGLAGNFRAYEQTIITDIVGFWRSGSE